MTHPFHQLNTITAALLSPDPDYNNIRQAAYALKDMFYEAIGFDEYDKTNQQHIQTDAGLAVGPMSAAFCIIDMMRTRKFLLGIRETIEEKLKKNPGKPVVVLYAGCGPFATLLTPLTCFFNPVQLQIVLLEINPVSLDYLQKTIQHFGMDEYIAGIEQADAVQYIIPEKYQPDILVSETMKPGLAKEPQVSLIANLLPQCNRQTALIPEEIKISVSLLGNLAANPEVLKELQTLLVLNATTAMQIKNSTESMTALLPGAKVHIQERPENHFTKLALNTDIKIYGNHVLGFNESGLTIPVPILDIAAFKNILQNCCFNIKSALTPVLL